MKEIILQDDEHDDNIDIECSLFGKIMNLFIILAHMSYIITFEFNKFECVFYKHILIWFIKFSLLNIIT